MDKYCPRCSKEYPSNIEKCPEDGSWLILLEQEDLIGKELDGRHKVLSKLGQGGMGVVYVAEQIMVGRKVALKVLRKDLGQDKSTVTRFFTEAKAIATLKNPHTVTLFDFGVTRDGLLYYTMELLEGKSLAAVIKKDGPLDFYRASHIVLQTLDSLEEAHRKEILHRDLKPDNIFLSKDKHKDKEWVTILDFGIAKLLGDSTVESVTRTGMICGTPAYLSPEQAIGNPAVPASDLYSLGIVLYEMLAGLPPFKETTPLKILMKHLHERPVPISVRNPDVEVPAAVDRFLLKVLEKDATKRYPNTEDFRSGLKEALAEHGQSPETVNLSPLSTSSIGLRSIKESTVDVASELEQELKRFQTAPDPHADTEARGDPKPEVVRSKNQTMKQVHGAQDLTGRPPPGGPEPKTSKEADGLAATAMALPSLRTLAGTETRMILQKAQKRKPLVIGIGIAVVLAIALAIWQPWRGSDYEAAREVGAAGDEATNAVSAESPLDESAPERKSLPEARPVRVVDEEAEEPEALSDGLDAVEGSEKAMPAKLASDGPEPPAGSESLESSGATSGGTSPGTKAAGVPAEKVAARPAIDDVGSGAQEGVSPPVLESGVEEHITPRSVSVGAVSSGEGGIGVSGDLAGGVGKAAGGLSPGLKVQVGSGKDEEAEKKKAEERKAKRAAKEARKAAAKRKEEETAKKNESHKTAGDKKEAEKADGDDDMGFKRVTQTGRKKGTEKDNDDDDALGFKRVTKTGRKKGTENDDHDDGDAGSDGTNSE